MSKKPGGSVPSTAGVQVDSTENLRKWLTSVLKPLCDADPAALAKYVLALIKKDKPEKELRQSMIDQLDVFLQQETKGFVDLLFETLNSKKYMSHIDLSDDTPLAATSENEDELQITVNSTLPSGLNNVSSESVSSSQPVHTSPAPTQETITPIANTIKSEETRVSRRERKDEDKDRNKRKSRSPRRSRSRSPRERSRRSRSPRDRDRERNRHRGRKLSPPIRRYERDIWDRRRSRSPARNRSASPRTRSRTPPRYRRPYHSRSRSKSRSRSQNRNRSRSPIREKVEKKDPLLPIPAVEEEPQKEAEKPMIPSVVVRPGVNDQSEKVGYATALQSTPMNIGNRCRDFDERGLCMRGELCPYDHGQDPLVLEDIIVPPHIHRQAQEFSQSIGNQPIFTGPPQIIRPSVPLMDVHRGHPLDIESSRHDLMQFLKTGEYYPDNPAVEPGLGWSTGQPPFRPRHMGPRGRPGILPRPMGPFPMPHQRELISVPVMGGPATNHMVLDMRGPHQMHQPLVRGIHTTRGRGRGGFDHGRLGMKPTRNVANCSLEVKKVPREQNNIMDLNSHFLRFGKIVNIQINFENDPEAALITFSSPMEAQSAYRCTEAVLNNRFIRVFWHNKEKENEDGVDGDSTRVPLKDRLGGVEDPEKLDQEKVLVSGSNLTKTVYNPSLLKKAEVAQDKVQAVEAIKKSQELLAAQESRKRLQEERKKEAIKLMGDLRKRKQDMMREQIEQQKKLISKLETNKSTMKPDEREKLMSLIKSLQESIETIKKDLEESSKVQILSQTATKNKEELIQTQREILDAELDLYNKEQEGGDTVALQKKVTELRVQAQSMGIIPRGRGSFRGAARGFVPRGRVIRGRGRMRSLRTVDRRPTKILITGFPPARLTDLLTHFAQFGIIEFYETDMNVPSMTISYGSRVTAEIAKGNGKTFGDVTLGIQWVANDMVDNSDKPNVNIPSNGEISHSEENDNAGSIEDDELGDILANEILLQYDEEDDDEDERSWRR